MCAIIESMGSRLCHTREQERLFPLVVHYLSEVLDCAHTHRHRHTATHSLSHTHFQVSPPHTMTQHVVVLERASKQASEREEGGERGGRETERERLKPAAHGRSEPRTRIHLTYWKQMDACAGQCRAACGGQEGYLGGLPLIAHCPIHTVYHESEMHIYYTVCVCIMMYIY